MLRRILLSAGLVVAAGAGAVSLAVAPTTAHVNADACSVTETIMGVTETDWYGEGTIMETDDGYLECSGGVWNGPNTDSPMPGGPILA
jgi:hypothetical protein